MFDWNRERYRTRDRLPPYPHYVEVPTVCPYENNNSYPQNLAHQLYLIAAGNGYTGDEETFIKLFSGSMNNKQVLFTNFSTFPQMGDYNTLYFDTNDKVLYYWDNEYIPINTTLIENTILEGGGA